MKDYVYYTHKLKNFNRGFAILLLWLLWLHITEVITMKIPKITETKITEI